MNSIFRPHGVYVSARRSMVVLVTTFEVVKGTVSVDVGGTVSVKTKTEKSTGKSASALDREGNER